MLSYTNKFLQAKHDFKNVLGTHFLLAKGAEVVVTATYQAWIKGYQHYLGLTEDEAVKVMENGVRLARRACQEIHKETGFKLSLITTGFDYETVLRVDARYRKQLDVSNVQDNIKKGEAEGLVAGSVGPYGASLHDGSEYTGIYIEKITSQELVDWHRPRVKALVDGGADFLAIETIPVLQEAEAIMRLLQEFPTAEASVSFSCKDGSQTCHGELFSDAVRCVYQSDQVIAVGLNCTSPQYVTPLLKSIEHLEIKKPILVKPNSGELWDGKDKRFYGQNQFQDLSDCIGEWINLGARWIGGCCRVYPDDIKRIKDKIIQKVKTLTK